MSETRTTKNYFAHGGNELVVGGKLTFLPGATVEGAEGLFDLPSGAPVVQIPYVEDSKATNAAGLREDYNILLSALRAAGIMAPAAETNGHPPPTQGTSTIAALTL